MQQIVSSWISCWRRYIKTSDSEACLMEIPCDVYLFLDVFIRTLDTTEQKVVASIETLGWQTTNVFNEAHHQNATVRVKNTTILTLPGADYALALSSSHALIACTIQHSFAFSLPLHTSQDLCQLLNLEMPEINSDLVTVSADQSEPGWELFKILASSFLPESEWCFGEVVSSQPQDVILMVANIWVGRVGYSRNQTDVASRGDGDTVRCLPADPRYFSWRRAAWINVSLEEYI